MKTNKAADRLRALRRTWKDNYFFKTMTSAGIFFGFTSLFALYHGYLGIGYSSVWHGGICVFYFLLVVIRGSILLTEKNIRGQAGLTQNLRRRRIFLVSAALLLVLDLTLIFPIAMMVVLAKPVNIGQIPAIAMAAYTTWKITMASIHIRRQKRNTRGSILVMELRMINFIDALVSVLTLQNTLIMVNQAKSGANSMLPISAASSGIIYIVIVAITIYMLKKGIQQSHLSKSNQ